MVAAVGPPAPPRRRSPNDPTETAERKRQGGRLELNIECSQAPTLTRRDVDVHHVPLVAHNDVGAQGVASYAARPRRCRSARAVPLEVDSGVVFHRARRSRFASEA
jgi:hypothetical protein